MTTEIRPVAVYAICRLFGTCQYSVSGPDDFVRTNYKQHLRETHDIRHPRVEPEEVRTLDDDAPVPHGPVDQVPA